MNTSQEKHYVELMRAVNPRDKNGNTLMPSPEQKKVIMCEESIISVIAGAGSGKTRTMTNRIAYCVGTGKVQPSEVIGLTFTNKAAGELAERSDYCLGQLQRHGFLQGAEVGEGETFLLLERPTISTYNSFASEIVAQYGMLIGRDPSLRLITEAERYQLMSQVVDSMTSEEVAVFDSARSKVIANALDMSAALLDHGASIEKGRYFFDSSIETLEDIASEAPNSVSGLGWPVGLSKWWTDKLKKSTPARLQEGRATVDLVEKYWKLKRERGVIEFADQVDMAVQILEKNFLVREEIASRYRLVLLDEYQDTSVRQAEMLHLALGNRDGTPLGKCDGGEWYSICAVGDPNQAIYGFRGASANAFSHFSQVFANRNVREFSLSTTYRNDKAILEAANAIAGDIETKGVDCNLLQERDNAGAGRVVQIRPLRREDSYQAIALRIRDKIAEVKQKEQAKKKDNPDYQIRGAEIAVLCLKRRYFDDIAKVLGELDIPYEIVGGTSILERPEIITLRSALIGATYPHRHDAFLRLFAYLNIGVADMRALSALVKTEEGKAKGSDASMPIMSEILEGLNKDDNSSGLSAEATRRLLWLAKVLRQTRERSKLPLADAIHSVSRDLGLELAAVSRAENSQSVQGALDSFVGMASSYQAEHKDADISDFLEWLDYVEAYEHAGEEESGEDRPVALDDIEVSPGIVQIMTIHSAKGLEWQDLVVIPEMVEGEFSDVKSSIKSWVTRKDVFPYPLRSDYEGNLPQFDFDYPYPAVYPILAEGEKGPTPETSPHYPLAYSLKKFEEEELQYESQEARRLAYVAFTRAAEELVLAGYGTKNNDLIEKKGGRGKDKEDLVIPLIAPSRFLRDIEKNNANKAIMCDIGDISSEAWVQEFGEEKSAALCQIFPVETTKKEKIAEITDEKSENYEKYKSLFSGQDWLLLEEGLSDNVGVDSTINIEAHNSYPLGLPRSLGALESYDEQSALSELDRLEEEADLLLKECEEQKLSPDMTSSHLTATAIVAMTGDAQGFTDMQRRPIPQENKEEARMGTQVHRRIAESYIVAPTIDFDMPDSAPDPHQETIDAFMSAFNQSVWATFPALHVESRVAFTLGDRVIECTIDAVLDTSSDPKFSPITIVDWKTGAVPSEEEMESRQLQLALYRLAYSKAWGYELDDIGAVFVHLNRNGTVREVEAGKMSEEEIVELISPVLSS